MFISLVVVSSLLIAVTFSHKYDPTWDSLDKRPIPSWYDQYKFGIFMHWGTYSVVGLRDAWFWYYWQGPEPYPDVVEYMRKNYPPDFTYTDFAPMFTTELFNASEYADI